MVKSQQNGTIGWRLRHERTRLGLTQSALASQCGLSKTTQVAYENDQRIPDALYLLTLREMGADFHFILTGDPVAVLTASTIQWDLMKALMETIETWASSRKVEPSLTAKMQLLEIFYSQFCVDGKADSAAISRQFEFAEAS